MKKQTYKRIAVATVREMNDLPMKQCTVGKGRSVLLCRVGKAFFAVDALCTHEAFSLADGTLEGGVVTCPMHGARFDVRTGKVRALPATTPLRTYPVEVRGGKMYIVLTS